MQEYVFNYEEYKRKLRKPAKTNISILLVVVIVLMGVVAFLKQSKLSSISCYFVEVSTFSNYSNANKLATKLSLENGAGVVYFDGNYHVLAGAYADEESTKKVVANIAATYPDAKTFKISAPKFRGNQSLNKAQVKATKNMIEAITNARNKMLDLTINYDTNTVTYRQAKAALTDLCDSFNTEKAKFFEAFSEEHDMFISKKRLIDMASAVANVSKCEEQELAQKLKCETVNLSISFTMFLNEVG